MPSQTEPRYHDLFQLLSVLVAVWFGVIPLGQRLFDARQGGLYELVFGSFGSTGLASFLVPILVIVVMFGVVVALHAAKKRGHR